MKQMQATLTKKGESNQRLAETVNMIKNQILAESVFDERYNVQQTNALMSAQYTVSGNSSSVNNFCVIAVVNSLVLSEIDPSKVNSSWRLQAPGKIN